MNAAALTFDEETHTYRFGGRKVPGVTTVMQQLTEDSYIHQLMHPESENESYIVALINWLRDEAGVDALHPSEGKHLAHEFMRAAADFGTKVHKACHLWNVNDLVEETLDPRHVPYLNSYRRFLSESGFVVTASEKRVYHRLMKYAGTADFYGTWRGTSWVVDIKTGIVPCTVGVQLAAYQQASDPRPRRRLCLQLKETGYKLHYCDALEDFSTFIGCLNVIRFKEKHNLFNKFKEQRNVSQPA